VADHGQAAGGHELAPSQAPAGAGRGRDDSQETSGSQEPSGGQATAPAGHAELTAVACLMMLERVNYLLSVEVRLPREEMVDRLTAIMFAAFHSP
jgi:hypothetical protein